ncbi:MAG: hypothetical protein IPK33_20910 [Gemmatimonadetes bacterium]|nr:hypothetical protein [Gemmatimonadota bacterium]
MAPNFTLASLPDGAIDLVALRTDLTGQQPDRIVIQRGLDPANNASLGTLNFAGAGAVAPATRSVTIQNMAGGEQSYAASFFRSANGTMVPIGTSIPGVGTTHSVGTVPAASLVTGDLHGFLAFAGVLSGPSITSGRTALLNTSSTADPSIALGATFNDPDVATGALGNNIVRVRTRITIQPDYDKLWLMQYSQSSGGINRNVIINVSGAYQALIGGPQLSLNMPGPVSRLGVAGRMGAAEQRPDLVDGLRLRMDRRSGPVAARPRRNHGARRLQVGELYAAVMRRQPG